MKELQSILERAEKESDERYAALQQKYIDLKVVRLCAVTSYPCVYDWSMLSCKPFTNYSQPCIWSMSSW